MDIHTEIAARCIEAEFYKSGYDIKHFKLRHSNVDDYISIAAAVGFSRETIKAAAIANSKMSENHIETRIKSFFTGIIRKRIEIDGVVYESIGRAAVILGKHRSAVEYMVIKGKAKIIQTNY